MRQYCLQPLSHHLLARAYCVEILPPRLASAAYIADTGTDTGSIYTSTRLKREFVVASIVHLQALVSVRHERCVPKHETAGRSVKRMCGRTDGFAVGRSVGQRVAA